jgi:hypothetical protein
MRELLAPESLGRILHCHLQFFVSQFLLDNPASALIYTADLGTH